MEIYKDLSNPASQEFEKLLNSQLSKIQIEEGKIIEGKINKITEKFVFLFIEGLKSEPVLDINELKSMGLNDKVKLGAPNFTLSLRPMLFSSLISNTGSLFKPSINKKTNFSVILLILPSIILPSSICILES